MKVIRGEEFTAGAESMYAPAELRSRLAGLALAGFAALALIGSPSPARAAAPCTRDQICGLKNAEDFVRLPGTRWAIASRLARDATPGALSLVDLERRTARALTPDFSGHAAPMYAACPGPPTASALITHGLDIRRRPDGASELFAVNHGGRQSIEIFDIHQSASGPQLKWKGCVVLAPDMATNANAVTALPDGVAVTSFGTTEPGDDAATLAGHPGGFVEKWAPRGGWTHVAGSGFGGDNGVTASPDGKTLYVNDWSDGTLRILSLDNRMPARSIRLGEFHPDNVHWLPDGTLLIAGQVGKAPAIFGCSGAGTCAVGFMVVIVDPRSSQVRLRWEVPASAAFAAASTALRYGPDYWVSSYRGDRVVRLGPAPDNAAPADSERDEDEHEDEDRSEIPTGQFVTPLAAPAAEFTQLDPHLKDFPQYRVGQAISEALSPDGRTLLILTSGFNILYNAAGKQSAADSNEYVFVYDVSAPHARAQQVLKVPNTFAGITFAPDGKQFYVSGGGDDDVHAYALKGASWTEAYPPIKLGHKAGNGIGVTAAVAGLAVTADGKELVAANYNNDSVSLIDLASRTVRAELDLRPGKSGGPHGVAGGENPFWVAVKGNSTAYIGSQRDREIDIVDISSARPPHIIGRIKLKGNPVKMLLDRRQQHLYVACDNSDVVAVIDTRSNAVIDEIRSIAPPGMVVQDSQYRGVAPNGLALSPDESHLYVTNGGMNAVAVVALDGGKPVVTGLIPTGWYPQAVVAGRLQARLYVVNSRSQPGPNPHNPNHRGHPLESFVNNEYILQLEKAGFLTFPLPSSAELQTLTQQVLANDHFNAPPRPGDSRIMAALRGKIRHVIYIIKENRTYDQVLGDLGEGNGDPAIAEFGARITPNFHALARGFVDLDNFYVSGEVSSDGWPWSTAARESDQGVKTVPPAYASRGISADTTGLNRGVNVAYATQAERRDANPGTPDDPDLLPGTNDVAGMDGPGGLAQQGYIWSAALRAGLTVRNYGMEGDTTRYAPNDPHNIPLDLDPHADHRRVMYPAYPDLLKISDPYYRSFDPAYPDFFREKEWQREFLSHIRRRDLPQLSLLWLPGDHMGDFARALDGVNTPELQQADNDYAVGLLVQAVATSPYRSDTLIFIVEDDAQDGPDHVDAHRSTAYVIGPYVRQHAVVSDYFTTVNLLRTMEDILGIGHLSIFDANDRPMTDIFDLQQKDWTFRATPSCFLAGTRLPLGAARPTCSAGGLQPTHDGAYWAARTTDMDFSSEDKIDPVRFNRIVWNGLMDSPYPTARSGLDMRPHTAKNRG